MYRRNVRLKQAGSSNPAWAATSAILALIRRSSASACATQSRFRYSYRMSVQR
jgi:hypothetical protein